MPKLQRFILAAIAVLVFGCSAENIFAQISQDSANTIYVPLIGISSVPEPMTLPATGGNVTYHYAVKNFLQETPLTNVQVVDDKCGPARFVEGDDNNDSKLDYSETWRYDCTVKLSGTTESITTATGTSNDLTAVQKSYATVVVGSNIMTPLINIVNVTKVAFPLVLREGGSDITFTYKVNNPGNVPLDNVSVTDSNCSNMSNKLGDTNYNQLLDINEVWIYTCTTHLNSTATSQASVSAYANGVKAIGYSSLTITVQRAVAESGTNLFDVGINPVGVTDNNNLKFTVWAILSGILAALIIFFFFKKGTNNDKKEI